MRPEGIQLHPDCQFAERRVVDIFYLYPIAIISFYLKFLAVLIIIFRFSEGVVDGSAQPAFRIKRFEC